MIDENTSRQVHRLSGRDWWPSRKNAVESGRLDRKDLDDMIKTENHPDVVSALIGTGEFDMDSEAEAIRRVITSPGLLTTYTNPMNRRYSLDQSRQEVVRQAARTMLEHAPVGMILSMPDDDDENWRTLIDTAATEYAGELGKDMLGLIAQSEGNTQARTPPRPKRGHNPKPGRGETCPTAATGWRRRTSRKLRNRWSRPPSKRNNSPSISTTCRPDLTPGRIGGKIIAKRN